MSGLVTSSALKNELTFQDRINAILKREEALSYSKLKHLTSPVNFVNNLMKPKPRNAGMHFGSLVDLLITEEERFAEKYIVHDVNISAGNQEMLVEKTLAGDLEKDLITRFREAFDEVYKRGKAEDYAHILQYCKLLEDGIICITKEQYQEAKDIAENLKSQPQIEDLLAQNEGMQKWLDFEYKGWRFKSCLDLWSCNNFYDFKFASQLNPDTFQRDIDKFGYDIQFGIYKKGLQISGLADVRTKGFFIVYDKEKNFSVMEFGEDYQSYAERKVDAYLNRLEKCIRENAWNRSYDFFEPNRVIRKPAYIKGFAE